MNRLFRIDLTSVPSYEERYQILQLFSGNWELNVSWRTVDELHKTIDYFDAFWFPSSSNPILPHLPDYVSVSIIG